MLELLQDATKFVLFDSWFSSSKAITSIQKQWHFDTITEFFHMTDEQLGDFTSSVVNQFPEYLRVFQGFISEA